MYEATVEKHSHAEWACSLPAFIILVLVIALGIGELVHARLTSLGDYLWNDYYLLRVDPVAPDCDPNLDLEVAVEQEVARQSAEIGGEFDLFGDEVDPVAIRQSLENSLAFCQKSHQKVMETQQRITPEVVVFRTVELLIAKIVHIGMLSKKYLLAVLVLLCAIATTYFRHHISLRPVSSAYDYYVSTATQLAANVLLLKSSTMFFLGELDSQSRGIEIRDIGINYIWITGFAILSLISLIQLVKPPVTYIEKGSPVKALLAIPLYTIMCLIAGINFILDGHHAGVSIYLSQMMELATLFLNLGIYIWIGMLLKQSQFVPLCIDVLRTWKLSPELLACVVLLVTVVPTAYTGASGIFVIAAGAIIYRELKASGARPQFSLAVTAMSGSTGVIIRPCLLVVIVAALNTEVTTDELYGWGVKVFIMTVALFAFVAYLSREQNFTFAPVSDAMPQCARSFIPLIPYIATAVIFILFFNLILETELNEFTAPFILPFMLIGLLFYERLKSKDIHNIGEVVHGIEEGLRAAIRNATNQTTIHIGALLMLMALTTSIGGLIQRTEIMELFPMVADSLVLTIGLLLVGLVLIGMIMEPYGAVILVSASLAPIAYKNGIDPIHFWMIALVAFELGYLSPPVALNHLLTRQVVGDEETARSANPTAPFWYRYERFLLPIVVVGTSLVIVAYVPLFFSYSGT